MNMDLNLPYVSMFFLDVFAWDFSNRLLGKWISGVAILSPSSEGRLHRDKHISASYFKSRVGSQENSISESSILILIKR